MTRMELPQVDFAHYHENPASAAAISAELVQALKRFGFVKIINHGISDTDLNQIFDHSQQFFAQDVNIKMTAASSENTIPKRGYSFVGQEVTSLLSKNATQKKDIKESFDFGDSDHALSNLWPSPPPSTSFRRSLEDFFDTCHRTHLLVLEAIANGLKLPQDSFIPLHSERDGELRLLHYPEVPAKDLLGGTKTRIAEHTDAGSLTLLFQDSTGGLEIELQESGQYMAVDAPLPAMLVNVGDSLQRWTNDHLRSVWHRVTAPKLQDGMDDELVLPPRYSVAYFGKPNQNASLFPFRQFFRPDTGALYKDVSSSAYRLSKLQQTYA